MAGPSFLPYTIAGQVPETCTCIERKNPPFFSYLKSASLLPGIVGLVSHSNWAGKHWGAGQARRKIISFRYRNFIKEFKKENT